MESYTYKNGQHPQFPTINNYWFKNVFGFDEGGMKIQDIKDIKDMKNVEEFHTDSPVNQNLEVNSSDLNNVSIIDKNDRKKIYNVGKVKFVSTGDLLQSIKKVDTADVTGKGAGLKYYEIKGNAGPLHYDPQLKGSLFQAASQFNALEMSGPNYIPEQGITIYKSDATQGPACALACPYATLYRNYFSMPGSKLQSGISDSSNNTSDQINALEDFEKISGVTLRKQNGYFYPNGVAEAKKINDYLTTPENFWNSVKLVKYFIHEDTPVVSAIDGSEVQKVAQIYCSALPLAYFPILKNSENFTKMILCAVYYATFAQAVVMAQTKGERVKVLITRVGGGFFGNSDDNIDPAINSALTFFKDYPIDVYYVNFNPDVTEFINPTTESPYPGEKDEKITPHESFQVGGANPSSDSSGSANPPVSSDTTPPTPNCNIDAATQSIKNITSECQEDIFKLATKDLAEQNILQKHLSVLRTDTQYATDKKLPPGSATIVDLKYYREKFAYPKDRVKLGTDKDDHDSSVDVYTFNTEILFVIQAAPAGVGATNISNQSVTNSVYNCLYLANANGVKGIAFPIIGGSIFFEKLGITKNKLYEILLQGVADYFNYFKDSKIEIVLFAHDSKVDDTDDFKTIFTTFVSNNKIVEDKLTELEGMLFTAEYQYNKIDSNTTKITALVNAANTEVQFGTGISGAFSQKLGRLQTTKEPTLDEKIFTISDDINSQGTEIKKEFKAAVDAYIANTNASPPSTPPSTPPASETPKKPFADVLTTLESQISYEHDQDILLDLLSDRNLIYPSPSPGEVSSEHNVKNEKNLNSAEPNIKKMIEDFESAETGDDTNFYLGACRSIQAAYELEFKAITGDENSDEVKEAKMRAKLLLNLRKNSLLLKVPARLDYATMKLGVVSGPHDTLDKLMNFSLQDTIEYYSQDGGDEGNRFRELNIEKEPTSAIVDGATISGIDGRFVKGIPNEGNTCFFNAALQLLLCDDDFIQLMIQGNCQYDTRDKFVNSLNAKSLIVKDGSSNKEICKDDTTKHDTAKKIINNLLWFFNKWKKGEQFSKKEDNPDENKDTNPIALLLDELSDKGIGNTADATEVLGKLFGKIDCIDNIFIEKFLQNFNFTIKENIINPEINSVIIPASENIQIFNFTPLKIISELPPEKLNRQEYNLIDLIKSNFADNDPKNFLLSFDDDNETNKKIFPERYRVFAIVKKLSLDVSKLKDNLSKIDLKDLLSLTENVYTDFFTSYKKSSESESYTTLLDNSSGQSKRLESIDKTIVTMLKTKLTELNSQISSLSTDIYEGSKNQFITDNAVLIKNISKIIDDIIVVITTPLAPNGLAYQAITEKSIQTIGKYFSCYVNRTYSIPDSATDGRYSFKIKIDTKITLNVNGTDTQFILLGFIVHIPGHYFYVKCDNNGNICAKLNDSQTLKPNFIDTYYDGITGFIYKRANESGQAGGGFKPNHNSITNHSKSKHNSSFKASSSKTKGKSRNRSHTQRVK